MLLPPLPDWTEIRLRVDREGCCLDVAGTSVWEAITPERRALFRTLIRLAFRGRCSQFRLVGFGRFKGRCWQWTVQPAREEGEIVAAELICGQLPPVRAGAPHFTPAVPAALPAIAPQLPAWLPS